MSLLSNRLARGRIHYGWYVAGITFVTLLVAAGIRSMPSILIVPVEQEFGWSPGDHLVRRRDQPDPVRADGPVRGGLHGSLGRPHDYRDVAIAGGMPAWP